MHFVELGEHMDDPGDLQPEGGRAENGADRRGSGHLFGGDAILHVSCLMEKFTAGDAVGNFVADATSEPELLLNVDPLHLRGRD